MDNGKSVGNTNKAGIFSAPSPDEQVYFTAGVGNELPENHNPEPEKDLNEDNWQRSLEISTPAGMPTPEQLIPVETVVNTTENAPVSNDTPNLGQITPITAPQFPESTKFNSNNIRTTGDRLDKLSVTEVNNIINELNQTGDLNTFYDEARNMTETNLNNSYNRKLYQDEGAA